MPDGKVSRFVLDVSYAITWVVDAERTPQSLEIFDALKKGEVQALVPSLWCDELANVLITIERAGKISAEQASAWVGFFQALPLQILPANLAQSLSEVRPFAQANGLTAYDAAYLRLAMVEQVPLATMDRQLIKTAPKVGVKLVT
jgi:predicted nucleic acid-binding protein